MGIKLALLALAMVLWAAPAQAATYYVDEPVGNDANDGSIGSPWLTITKASATAVAGDTVNVLAGTYIDPAATWQTAFSPANSGTAGNPITFKSSPPLAAILTSPKACVNYTGTIALLNDVPAFGIDLKDYITVDGFTVVGALQSKGTAGNENVGIVFKNNVIRCGFIQGADVSLNWGIIFQLTSNSQMLFNKVYDMADSGNYTHNTSGVMLLNASDNLIENNDVNATNVGNAYGHKGGGNNRNTYRKNLGQNSIINGFFSISSTNGLVIDLDNTYSNNLLIAMPRCFGMTYGSQGPTIDHNTCINVRYVVAEDKNSTLNVDLTNNLAVGVSTYGIPRAIFFADYRDTQSTACPVSACPTPPDLFTQYLTTSNYNLFSGFTSFAYRENNTLNYATLASWQAAYPGFDANSLTSTPIFADAAGGNYTLTASSPGYLAASDGTDMGAKICAVGITTTCVRDRPPVIRTPAGRSLP